ncbi:MAG: methyltransferase domain-containing protein [bacterium]|nr:methyltransferase domain-containing protein [bacterium]
MKIKLLKLLVCPEDSGDLKLVGAKQSGDEIEFGDLVCEKCGHNYPIVRYVPRFVASDEYVGNFSLEWIKHITTQLDSANKTNQSYSTFTRRTGFNKDDFAGKMVLDVGCGTGRFMEVARNLGAEVVGIDLSYAVESAQRNFAKDQLVHIIQANVFKLPFRKQSFNHVYSIGVLHHTPNTRLAFEKSLEYLRPNGKIAIWVYNNWGIYNKASDFYRIFTTRLPEKLLYKICQRLTPVIYFFHKRGKAWRYIIPIPISYNSDPDWRILDTFDWYSPKYQWKHTMPEVTKWFKEAGLEDVATHEVPVSVSGRKI